MHLKTSKVRASKYWDIVKDRKIPKDYEIPFFKNVWGEEVLLVPGQSITVNQNKSRDEIPGAHGFDFEKGLYINSENGKLILSKSNPNEYIRLREKYLNLELLILKVNREVDLPNFSFERGPNNSVTIFDRYIVKDCFWALPSNKTEIDNYSKAITEKITSYITAKKESLFMKTSKLEECVIQAVCNLDVSYLRELDDDIIYSYQFKDDLIIEFANKFKRLALKGISSLNVKPSKCLYCYKGTNAFSFHHPETDEFIIRYVIGMEEQGLLKYILTECRNKPIPDGPSGMPF